MPKQLSLPFTVGQLAEARSFLPGYRSAWFRCKIKEITQRGGQTAHALEYYDFPDEKIKWTRVYQIPPKGNNKTGEKRELMVRPHYPRIYTESEMPDVNTLSEVIVVTDRVWKVGDLVDWFTDGCFWSGRVTDIINENMVKVELPPPPIGEGSSYEVLYKDLRPSLDWSPEFGWRMPASVGSGKGCASAQLIQPGGQACSLATSKFSQHSKEKVSLKRRTSTIFSKEETQVPMRSVSVDVGYSGIGKSSCSDSISSAPVRGVSAEVPGAISHKEQHCDDGSSKKVRADETIPLNCMGSDTIESMILDLEELVNRVKWLKRMLEFGIPLPDSVNPAWKFLEHLAVSAPK
ncbi:hypothetical protein Ancab_013188 [Ancistrocladus abbreviatus]